MMEEWKVFRGRILATNVASFAIMYVGVVMWR